MRWPRGALHPGAWRTLRLQPSSGRTRQTTWRVAVDGRCEHFAQGLENAKTKCDRRGRSGATTVPCVIMCRTHEELTDDRFYNAKKKARGFPGNERGRNRARGTNGRIHIDTTRSSLRCMAFSQKKNLIAITVGHNVSFLSSLWAPGWSQGNRETVFHQHDR